MALTKVDISLMDNVGTTANKLLTYDGSGNLPAVDGSQLTNPNTGVTESASDPTISTNPSGGAGSEWHNTTSGEVYICTDATAGENVWTNVGAGTGDVAPVSHAAGGSYGYMSGGAPTKNFITRYSFTTDGNDADVGDLSVARYGNPAGSSDTTHGYTAGGNPNTIDRFSFSAGGNAVDVGDLLSTKIGTGSSQSLTYSYAHGANSSDVIEKFAFGASANSTDVGNLTSARSTSQGCSSATHGYICGGNVGLDIDKYSHSSDGNGVDVGNIPASPTGWARRPPGGSTRDYGYYAGGATDSIQINKFSFASEGTQTDVGDLIHKTAACSSTSSYTHGYVHGGYGGHPSTNVYINIIQKYSYTVDADATDVGDLGSPRSLGADMSEGCGQQY